MKLFEVIDDGIPQHQQLLHCFDNSWRLMMKLVKGEPQEVMDKYKLVHAMVTNVEGRTFPHGWLELNGKAIDSSRSMDDPQVMDAVKYRDALNATNIIEYEPHEAMIKAAREKNLGPWDPRLI